MDTKIVIKCFPVLKIAKPFTVSEMLDEPISENKNTYEVDWSSNDAANLSHQLANQIRNEVKMLRMYKNMCRGNTVSLTFQKSTFTYLDPGIDELSTREHRWPLTFEQHKSACLDLNKAYPSYLEVFDRDADAYAQKNFDTKPYAVVLLKDDIYIGHIYTWISPREPSICLAIGIRASISEIPKKQLGLKTSAISSMLLEGVRQFALHKRAKEIVVVWPLANMVPILKNLGFKEADVATSWIGNSINPVKERRVCTDCQILINITEPLSQEDIILYRIS